MFDGPVCRASGGGNGWGTEGPPQDQSYELVFKGEASGPKNKQIQLNLAALFY